MSHCDHALSVRPSFTFYIFGLFSETAERNAMKLDGKLDLNVLPKSLFLADWETKMAVLASDWLRHFWLLCNRWTKFNETSQEGRTQSPLPRLCFRTYRKTTMATSVSDWLRYCCLISAATKRNQTKLHRKQDHNVLYQVRFFPTPIGKPRWPPRYMIV